MKTSRTIRFIAACSVFACTANAGAQQASAAAAYPSKPIRFIIPFPAGGTTDVAARMIGQKMTEAWGQPALVESKVGAGSVIGSEFVAKAPPDGHTLLVNTIAFTIVASLHRKLPYDSIKDFAPVIHISSLPLVLVLHPSLPARSVKELIALARARPGQLNYASSGSGTSPHLAGEMFKTMAGVDMVHVPYKGSAMGANALLGGHVMMSFSLLPAVLPQIQANRLRAIAATTTQRMPALPNLPTIAESGLPEYEITSWQGVWAPAAVAPDIVGKLNREIARIIRLPDVNERITSEGAVPVASSPAEFSSFVRRELVKWAKVVKASGAQAD
jgi:tripartite-type tricarboxylate transporter receptor subunit TctC